MLSESNVWRNVDSKLQEISDKLKSFSKSKARCWHNTWRPDKKTVQTAKYTERCKWTIKGYVYLLCKYIETFHNECTFLLFIIMFYSVIHLILKLHLLSTFSTKLNSMVIVLRIACFLFRFRLCDLLIFS